MPGLILEGGALRAVYTAGALDALIDLNIQFNYVIGVSAGITNGYSYVSGQRGRNWEVIRRYRRSPRYFSVLNYPKSRSLFGLDFIYGQIPQKLVPYDYDALGRFEGTVLTGVTNPLTGRIEYYDQSYIDRDLSLLRASCAIPYMFPAIPFNGGLYYDGGLSDPIPIRRALADGHKKNLIILTREPGYRKTSDRTTELSTRAMQRKYPHLARVMRDRHLVYNGLVGMVERLEETGDAVVLRPSAEVNVPRLEKDIDRLEALYRAGYHDATEKAASIAALFAE